MGLFGKPTLVNNVETFVNVVPIVAGGGMAFAALGTEGIEGSQAVLRLGAVARPGVFEVEFGATLRELLDLAGGVRGGAQLQAILLGGAAGGFVGPDDLDLPLTMEAARHGRHDTRIRCRARARRLGRPDRPLHRIAAFFRMSRAGNASPAASAPSARRKCSPACATNPRPGDLQLFRDLAKVMRDASICGLGQTAPSAIESAIDRLGVFQ